MKILKSNFVGSLLLFFSISSFAQQSPLWVGLKKGSYEVGFQVLQFEDKSRQVQLNKKSTIPRPIETFMWYPTTKGSQQMDMNKYFVSFGLYRNFQKKADEELITWARKTTVKYIFTKTTTDSVAIDRLFEIPTEAYLNAPKVEGQFPLVFVMGNTFTDLFLLSEYLASHGFYVVSKYNDGLITNKWEGWSSLGKSVNNDLIDLHLISTHLQKEKNINFEKIGLVGYHGSMESNILFQIQNSRVRAVISLDGAEVWSFNPALKATIYEHPVWDSTKVDVPYLRFHSDMITKQKGMDFKDADWWFYRATKHPVTFINIPNLNHYDFMSFLNANSIVPGFTGTENKYPNVAHQAICEYTFHFLNNNLKDDRESKIYLKNKPIQNGFPNGLLEIGNRSFLNKEK